MVDKEPKVNLTGEISEQIAISILRDGLQVNDFDCGDPVRNSWLQQRAFSNHRRDDTRTYVASTTSGEVAGFYALTVGSIVRTPLPGPLRRNVPDPVSCVLLAQVAVSVRRQKRGLGRDLVLHAMGQTVKIAQLAGCRLFAVHPARPDLVGYYANFGFTEVNVTPPLMAMSLHRVRTTLAAVCPEIT